MMRLADEVHLTAISRMTQLEAQRRAQSRRHRRETRRDAVRLRLGALLVRAGLRIAKPMTSEGLLAPRGCPAAGPPR